MDTTVISLRFKLFASCLLALAEAISIIAWGGLSLASLVVVDAIIQAMLGNELFPPSVSSIVVIIIGIIGIGAFMKFMFEGPRDNYKNAISSYEAEMEKLCP